jgi:glutathione S-transferase
VLARLDGYLAGRKYVAGDQLTMGDIAFGPVVYLVQNVPFDRPKLANYDAWYARISERPAFRKVVALPVA